MLSAKGVSGLIQFDGQFVTIVRKGFLARVSVGKGEKRIPLASITAVQWKPAGALVNGYIQFTIPGSKEQRSQFGRQTVDAAKDEDSVVFTKKQMPDFEQMRTAVDQAIAQRGMVQSAPAASPSLADELAKLAGLAQQGILSQAEFEAQKARLLSR